MNKRIGFLILFNKVVNSFYFGEVYDGTDKNTERS